MKSKAGSKCSITIYPTNNINDITRFTDVQPLEAATVSGRHTTRAI